MSEAEATPAAAQTPPPLSVALSVILQNTQQLKHPPGLFRINGIGTTAGGILRDERLTPYYVISVWFTFIFIPLIQTGSYLASPVIDDRGRERGGTYYFHRQVSSRVLRQALGNDAPGRLLNASVKKFAIWVLLILGLLALIVFFAVSDNKAPDAPPAPPASNAPATNL